VTVVKTYRATATREDGLWVVDVHGVGVTQGYTVDEARHLARDYVATMTEVPLDEVRVDVDFQHE
jgi:hypothetical protein